MAKVYESKAPNRMVITESGKLKFKAPTPGGFGELASDDGYTLARTGLKSEQIEEIVERQGDFVNRVPGQAGIWLKEDRVHAANNERFCKIRAELRALGAPALRRKLAESNLEVPVNASDDDLVSLVLEAMAKGALSTKAPAAPPLSEAVQSPRPNLRRGAATARRANSE
jgi:hypothetical protein